MIDLHCHVLPGIDDGPSRIDESLALARAAADAGTRTIVATPHVSPRYPNESGTIARLTDELNQRLRAEDIPVEILTGAEIAATRIAAMPPEEISALALGRGSWLLVECPYARGADGFDTILLYLKDRGHRILLAHPERCAAFQREPRRLESLLGEGMLTSISAGSLAGDFGTKVRRFAMRLVESQLVHNVASDAHDAIRRPPRIAGALEQAGLGALSEWLTSEVPSAILEGGEIPARPSTPTPTGRRLRPHRWRARR